LILLQVAVEGEQNHDRKADVDSPSSDIRGAIISVQDMKILLSDSDMKLLTTNPEMIEEELYRYGSMKGDGGVV